MPYYYDHMTKPQQATYRAMLQGLNDLSPEFQIPRLEGVQLYNVFLQLRLDHPEVFWAVSFQYRYYPDSPSVIFTPVYLFDKGKIRDHQKALSARIARLTRPAQGLSPLEKVRYVHDFVCTQIRYDKLKKPYSHEIIGPLGQGVGVCEGIAKAVKALCDALGIWCMVAICDNNPEKGIKYRHTWNIVRLDNCYLHLDATFDNTLTRSMEASGTPEIRYDYFALGDKAIFRDHQPVIFPIPLCPEGDRFYYRQKKLSFTKLEDVTNRARQCAKKGKPLTFHWRGGYLTRAVLEEMLPLLQEAGAQRQKTAHISINRPQAVIHLSYTDTRADHSLTLENANEGEDSPADTD